MNLAPPPPGDGAHLFKRTMVVMAGIGLALAIWQLQQLLLLLFASALTAQMFHGLATQLQRRMHLPFGVALALAVLLPVGVLALVFGLFGAMLTEQFAILSQQLPAALKAVRGWLGASSTGQDILRAVGSYDVKFETVVGLVQRGLANLGAGLSQLVLILVAGVYLAAQPHLYLGALIRLAQRLGIKAAETSIKSIDLALSAWLKAQAVSMAFVALGTGIGLSVVGLPSALAIGLVAGLCEFVPYLGVILVSAPATLIGFSIDIETGVLTMVTLIIVQQVQGNLVTPMAQGRLADLPPALTLFSLIAFGIMLGPLGVILAVPLTVVLMVLYRHAMQVPALPPTSPPPGPQA